MARDRGESVVTGEPDGIRRGGELTRGTGSVVQAPGIDERSEEPEVLDLALAPAAPRGPQAVEQTDEVAGLAGRPAARLEAPHHRPRGLALAIAALAEVLPRPSLTVARWRRSMGRPGR
jgi:hypothetical protein